MSESEATAIRFTIDHYEPRKARPDLENAYENLMYACDECNQRKGDRSPPPKAREDGYRFFRPDEDLHADHFELHGVRLEGKTRAGEYSIEAIDLNRFSLRKLRDIRERLSKCHELVAAGVLALKAFHIDRLPPSVKGSAAATIAKAIREAGRLEEEIDNLLQNYARSPLHADDPDAEERAQKRAEKLNEWKALYPGSWRGRERTSKDSKQ